MGDVREERKTDLRVVKTRAAIQAAFERLLKTTGYDQITVSAIAREACVSRKTFYAHYSSVDDLLGVVAQEVVDEIAHEIQPEGELVSVDEWVSEFARATLTKLRDSPYWSGNVMQFVSTGSLVEVFRGPLERLCREELGKRGLAPAEGYEYAQAFFIGGLCAAYETWLSLGRGAAELDEAAETIARAAIQGVGGLLVPAAG